MNCISFLEVNEYMAKKQSLEKKKILKEQSQQRKADRVKEENAILNKCLGMLGVLVIAEIYFLICYRFFVQGTMQSLVTTSKVIGAVSWIGLAAAVVGIILAVAHRGKKHARWGNWLALLGAVLFLGGRLMLAIYPVGTTVVCVAVPLLALAGFVYYLYQKEFFCSGLGLGVAVFGMWLSRRAAGSAFWDGKALVLEIVLLIVVLALLAFSVAAGRNGGKWGKGEKEKVVFSGTTNYNVMYGTLVLAAAALLVAMFAPAAALYLMWGGIALLFVLAVYYTIHLM